MNEHEAAALRLFKMLCTGWGAPELSEKYLPKFKQCIEEQKELARVRNRSQDRDKELEKAKKRDKAFWSKVKIGGTAVASAGTVGLFAFLTAPVASVAAPLVTVAAPVAQSTWQTPDL